MFQCLNKESYVKINLLKKHITDKEKPLSVMFHDFKQLESFVELDEEDRRVVQKNWDKGFTFLVEKNLKKLVHLQIR